MRLFSGYLGLQTWNEAIFITRTRRFLRNIQRIDTQTCRRGETLLLYGQWLQLLLLNSASKSYPASRFGETLSEQVKGRNNYY